MAAIDSTITIKKTSYMNKQNRPLYLFLIPGAVILILFNYLPIYGLEIAFKNFNPMLGITGSRWVGFKHFDKLFHSIFFWRVFKNTLIINVMQLVFGFPAPILLALMLNELRTTGVKRTVQTVTYLPHFLSWVVIGGFVMDILSPNQGLMSSVSMIFTGEKSDVFLLIEPGAFRWILVFSAIWQSIGWQSIVFISAISGINPELYEASEVDGANRFHNMWYITLPSIAPTIFVLFIIRVGHIMGSNFEQIFVLLNPNVYSTGDVISTYVYREGLGKGNYSYTAAVGLFQSVIGFVMVVMTNRLGKKMGQNLW